MLFETETESESESETKHLVGIGSYLYCLSPECRVPIDVKRADTSVFTNQCDDVIGRQFTHGQHVVQDRLQVNNH